MSNILIDLGFLKIYWYSFFIFMALLVGGTLALKESSKWGISEDSMINMFFYLIPISLIGARIYYVAFNWGYYSENIPEIFQIWEGGLAIHGAILAGVIFVILYCSKNGINISRMTDILSVSLIIGQAIGRWGNFFNQEAHGGVVSIEFLQKIIPFNFIIEGMNIDGIYYHPTFLYESLWCLLGFIILLIVRRMRYTKIGQITGLYLVWYGAGRYFIEALRTDSLMLGNMKMAQLVSIAMVVIGILIFFIKGRGFKLEGRYNSYS
ncbi:MAG: prolipoprotein diacylglyceryl transferase [Bacilli bacterium]|nr:prolipoprotein diacylglyceryl transferase [Bacilli bacterium]